MNNLLKILTTLVLVVGLNADQGMFSSLVPQVSKNPGYTTNDLYVHGNDIYGVTASTLLKFENVNMTFSSNNFGGTNKAIISTATDVFVLQNSSLTSYNTDTNASKNTLTSTKYFNSFAISDDEQTMYVGTTTGVLIVDISNTSDMNNSGFIETTNALDLVAKGDYLYVADDWGGLKIINISNPNIAYIESSIDGEFVKIAYEHNNLFVLGLKNTVLGLSAFDISSPSAPNLASTRNIIVPITENTSLHIADMYAYIGDGVYDVSNKSNIKEVLPFTTDAISSTVSNGAKIYQASSTTTSVVYSTVTSDYDDNISAASSQTAKTIVSLRPDEGAFGNLSDKDDVDFIKITLANGKFNATITGLSDLNVSLYDSNDTGILPIASVLSTDNSKVLNMSVEVGSGTHYLKLESTANDNSKIGDYKITNDYEPDDWSDTISSASLINTRETIKGNISKSDDQDYFRIDLVSKGVLSIKSSNGDIIDAKIRNSYNDTFISGTGDFAENKIFNIPRSGTYYIDIIAFNDAVVNQDYSFKVSFSKDALLDIEDDSVFALKKFGAELSVANDNYGQIKSDGGYIYFVNNSASTLNRSDETFHALNVFPVTQDVKDYEIIADNIYVLTDNKLIILRKDLSPRGFIGTLGGAKKVVINANYAYVISTNSSRVEIFDISQKDEIISAGSYTIANNINDIAIKSAFSEEGDGIINNINHLQPFLYLATNNGLYIYNFSDITNLPTSIPSPVVYKSNKSFYNILITNPYTYLVSSYGFEILFIKKATSTPKFKGLVSSINNVKDILINQDFAYITNFDDILQVIDIKDQTSPKLIDLPILRAESIFVEDGLGYVVTKINNTDTIFGKLSKYDMSKDYADVKGKASLIKYDKINYGVISKHRVTDVDIFYIDTSSFSSLTFTTNGDVNATYNIKEFNSGNTVNTFSVGTLESNNSLELPYGEYYLEVSATTSGSYNFGVLKTEDDLKDNFTDASSIVVGESYDANITTNDIDIVKVVLTQRGKFIFSSDTNISIEIYYNSDTSKSIADETNLSSGISLSAGTYYIKMKDNGHTGKYTFTSSFVSNGELSMPDGFDDIRNFNATHTIFGDRYIYTLTNDNKIAIYNHLLQKVEEGSFNGDILYSKICGKVIFDNNKIYLNPMEYDGATSKYECGRGFISMNLEDITESGDFTGWTFHPKDGYFSEFGFSESIIDRTIVGVNNNYSYEYSDANNSIYKVNSNSNAYNAKIYGKFSVGASADIDSIKFIKNDGNIDFIAIDDKLYAYKSNPDTAKYLTRDVYDANGNVIGTEQYHSSTEATIIDSTIFNIDVQDLYIDRDAKKLYVLVKNSTIFKTIDYSSSLLSTAVIKDTDIGYEANSMYVRQNEVYFTFKSFGVRVYDFPLTPLPTPKKSIENIGPNILNIFSYDGTTFNYLSNGNLQVGYLSDTFVDGTTSGTYSVVDDVKEGEGGFEGCFIATAAYGNYFQPNVKILRDFRDNYLLQNELGRIFVDFYYRHSPSIAAKISKSESVKAIIRTILTPIVYMIKYPLESMSIFMLVLIGSMFKSYISKRRVAIFFASFTLMFSACDNASDNSNTSNSSSVAILKPFIVNIDENVSIATSPELGSVEVSSSGSSNISSFRLEGSGYRNFDIDSRGLITTRADTILDCTTSSKYNLKVIATNSYGDSKAVTATIQVNCLDVPILSPLILNISDYQVGTIGTLNILRAGAVGDTNATVSKIELSGDEANGLSISSLGVIQVTSPLGSSLSQYNILVRAINNNDKVGPYVPLTINVNNTFSNTSSSVVDDFPDYLDTTIGTSASIGSYSSYYYINGGMNHLSDHDYIKIYIESDNTNISLYLATNGVYTNGNGGNYIALYDELYNYYGTYSSDYPAISLNSGYYYVNVHETADSYTLNINVSSNSVQNSARYSRANEIVYDNNYNLSWQDDYDVQSITKQWLLQSNYDACVLDLASPSCDDTAGDTATTYCTDLTLSGYTDWRLPSDAELSSIVEPSNYPTIDNTFQNTSPSDYWSSSTYPTSSENAYATTFDSAYTLNRAKNTFTYVRCVRNGP